MPSGGLASRLGRSVRRRGRPQLRHARTTSNAYSSNERRKGSGKNLKSGAGRRPPLALSSGGRKQRSIAHGGQMQSSHAAQRSALEQLSTLLGGITLRSWGAASWSQAPPIPRPAQLSSPAAASSLRVAPVMAIPFTEGAHLLGQRMQSTQAHLPLGLLLARTISGSQRMMPGRCSSNAIKKLSGRSARSEKLRPLSAVSICGVSRSWQKSAFETWHVV
mmetsp:Transcript_113545/g.196828  ORF Transcript_113545/g.196828 Transcript_113545/m.196828 type:complete len:219 (-) Transcript_113545:82-738(-)